MSARVKQVGTGSGVVDCGAVIVDMFGEEVRVDDIVELLIDNVVGVFGEEVRVEEIVELLIGNVVEILVELGPVQLDEVVDVMGVMVGNVAFGNGSCTVHNSVRIDASVLFNTSRSDTK